MAAIPPENRGNYCRLSAS